jgi:ketosteroid isomerase-like protein
LTQVKTSDVTVSNRDVTVAGDWAIETGTFDWTVAPVAGGTAVRDQGNFVAIWRRQPDSSWKATRLIWNSSQPLPGAAPAP